MYLESEGKRVCLIIGCVYGEIVLIKMFFDMFYVDCVLEVGVLFFLFDDYEDWGLYVVMGVIDVVGDIYVEG